MKHDNFAAEQLERERHIDIEPLHAGAGDLRRLAQAHHPATIRICWRCIQKRSTR